MKNPSLAQYIRYFKIFVASVTLSATFISITTEKAEAHHTQKVKQLKRSNKRWIQVDLSEQRLIAWQGNKAIFGVIVSTGKRSTPTPTGVFNIYVKLRKTRMRGEGYDVPNVPYTMYYQGGYGIHGAYWHNKFGTPVSHGCVNVAPNHAKRLFNWASVGTTVVVQR